MSFRSILSLGLILLLGQGVSKAQLSWLGAGFPEQDEPATLLFDATGTPLAGSPGTLYLHTGVTLDGALWQNVIGSWGDNTAQPALTSLGGNLYQLVIGPSIESFYGVSAGNITQISAVVRNAAGNTQTADLFIQVGNFSLELLSPDEGSTLLWTGGSIAVLAQNSGGAADYVLEGPGGSVLAALSGDSLFSTNIADPANGDYRVTATQDGVSLSKNFSVIRSVSTVVESMPAGMVDGVNYLEGDDTRAVLVLHAPGKDFVYVAGNFNGWSPGEDDAMKRDPASNKFWLELDSLVSGEWYAFQYWVGDQSPYPQSPVLVKTADPFSTLVLSAYDDPEILALNTYPGLPDVRTLAPGQEREMTVIQTGPSAFWQYTWSGTEKANRVVPKEDLVIYEVLLRDFDSRRTFQDLIDRIDYFDQLNINAIQLMPIMEFEGNMSWGYNPVYHLALDKRYGTPAQFKEFVDVCHQRGIAVILDIALNHVFGRSPLERMWMIDTNNDGWSNAISPDNPYCNTEPRHTANVGADLNHFREPENLTNTYVLRTIQHWIEEYRIDGFRWDLTQGFTNSCSASDGSCTGSNLPDRIGKLKWYADNQWSLDPYFYVIFEHWAFGEMPEYTNYRLAETPAKGILCWRRADYEFADVLKGFNGNISNTSDASTLRIQGNMESHDEERIAYRARTESGQTSGNRSKILSRMPALGSVFFLVPGPKMIWHFAELGWDLSINTCSDGTIGDCRLDTKPQPQWVENWMEQPARRRIYDEWAVMMDLRTGASLFEEGEFAFNLSVAGRPRLDVWTSTSPSSALSYAMVHANFSNSSATFPAYFPYTGTWYNLMTNEPLVVTSTTQSITLNSDGGYLIYGNQPNPYSVVSGLDESAGALDAWLSLSVVQPVRNNVLEVTYQLDQLAPGQMQLFSGKGQLLWQAQAEPGLQTIKVPMELPAGMYWLELRAGDQARRLPVVFP